MLPSPKWYGMQKLLFWCPQVGSWESTVAGPEVRKSEDRELLSLLSPDLAITLPLFLGLNLHLDPGTRLPGY